MSSPTKNHNKANASPGEGGSLKDHRSLIEASTLFRVLSAESVEVRRLKWLESEKAGRDIGFDRAVTSWVTHHCGAWRAARKKDAGRDDALTRCDCS